MAASCIFGASFDCYARPQIGCLDVLWDAIVVMQKRHFVVCTRSTSLQRRNRRGGPDEEVVEPTGRLERRGTARQTLRINQEVGPSEAENSSSGAWTLSMQVQSQLSSAFARAGGIDLRSVDCIAVNRTDQSALKLRLSKILGIAIGLGPSEVLLLKDRKFISRCRKVSPNEKSRAVARFVNDRTEMLERILRKFLDFDFHLYIVHEMDNETFSVWNGEYYVQIEVDAGFHQIADYVRIEVQIAYYVQIVV
eukprot:scaffold15083_cov73-Cylindrotheca_fusiformis.AAC.1